MPDQPSAKRLIELGALQGCSINPQQAERCIHYARILLTWNRRINLTRITQPEDLLAKHLLDAILAARWLPSSGAALDLGSGTGVPAIPVQIVRPELHFTLIEKQRKKVSFLKVCLAELGLRQARVVAARWQDYAALQQHPEPRFDLITLRAIKPTPQLFSRLNAFCLKDGAQIAFWAGPSSADAEFQDLIGSVPDLSLTAVHSYCLPYRAGSRRLVLWRKTSSQPPKALP